MKEIRPDLKDRKILSELDFNARQPVSNIAKKVRLSKEVTLYRIKKLEESGSIKQYYAIINTAKLGYYYCRLILKLQNINEKTYTQIINSFKGDKKVAYLGILDGFYDIIIGYWAKDMLEFENFIDDFIFRYGKYISEKDVSIGLHLSQFNYRFLLDKIGLKEFETGGEIKNYKIDEIDNKLLTLLTKNARFSLEGLGKKLNMTGKAIKYRIKNLLKNKIIIGFRTLINYKNFGYENNKILLYLQNLNKLEFDRLNKYLKLLPNCIYITKAIGKTELEFEILIKNREEFFNIIKDLREKFSNIIKSYNHFILHEEPISRFIPIEN